MDPGHDEFVVVSRILVTDSLHPAGVAVLEDAGAVVEMLPQERRADLPQIAAEFDALIVRTRTEVTAALLAAAPRVRVVGRAGAGIDNIDVEAARANGVEVVSAPEANAVSAAEHTFALLLAVARRVPRGDSCLKRSEWCPDAIPMGMELAGRTVGVVGFGRIGQRVAIRARAFEMEVLINDPVIDEAAVESIGVEVVQELSVLLHRSDCLTVHVPLDATTRGLIGPAELARLPAGAIVINCARGGVVDEEALLEVLDQGQVGGAGIDVFGTEPLVDFRLASHPRVVATPHLGAHTEAAKRKVGVEVAHNVLRKLRPRPSRLEKPGMRSR